MIQFVFPSSVMHMYFVLRRTVEMLRKTTPVLFIVLPSQYTHVVLKLSIFHLLMSKEGLQGKGIVFCSFSFLQCHHF